MEFTESRSDRIPQWQGAHVEETAIIYAFRYDNNNDSGVEDVDDGDDDDDDDDGYDDDDDGSGWKDVSISKL